MICMWKTCDSKWGWRATRSGITGRERIGCHRTGALAQVLLAFAEELERKPICPDDVPAPAEPEYERRRVKRRKGRQHLANFENLPVTTQVYELSAEERACPCCGVERKEIGAEEI